MPGGTSIGFEPRRLLRLGLILAAVASSVGAADRIGLLSFVQTRLSDLRFQLHPRAPGGDIVLVDIDARSLAEVGRWPWPRTLHADLVRAAADAGAARIAFDVDFSSVSEPAADQAFADAIDETGIDTLLAAFKQTDAEGREQSSLPIDPLLRSAWPAAVNVAPDPDGLVRRLPSAVTIGQGPVTSMPVLLAGREPAPGGPFGIDFSIDARRIPRLSFSDVLAHRVDPALLAGRTLLVGASAVELHDLFPAPGLGMAPGSTLLALGAETLLQDRALHIVAVPWVLVIVGAALMILFVRRLRLVPGLCLLAATAVTVELCAFLLQDQGRLAVETASLHIVLTSLSAYGLSRELNLRRVLAWIAGVRADNSQSMLERVVDEGFGGVILIDETSRLLRVNAEARHLLGLAGGGSIADLPEAIADDCRAAVLRFEAEGSAVRSTGLVRRMAEGRERTLEYSVAPLRLATIENGRAERSGSAVHLCLALRDVTERQMVEDRMRHLALHDALTSLANRTALATRVAAITDETADERTDSALLAFDLDRFKTVNDALGHGIGDQVLIEVGRRAVACMPPDAVVARIGGDEYMVLLPGRTAAEALALGQRLAVDLHRPIFVSDHRLSVGASIGLCGWSGAAVGSEDLFRRADLALYRAKKHGGIQLFEPSMEEDRLARLALERDLEEAVASGSLAVAFQPQVSLRSGEVTGAEALVRWHHPRKGPISPALFIPVAEETGLIHRIGAQVLYRACEEAASWERPVRVAVNVSALQLSTGDVVATVRGALAASGLPPERLELEITESAFVAEDVRLKTVFDDLLALGIRFSLDDFGTGYSSLGYLNRFPVSKLKIDRSFVKDLPGDGPSLAILRSILTLTQGLGLKVIAEGIETDEQADCLRMLGCGEGQGYLYSRPIDAEAMRRFLVLDERRTAAIA